MDKQYRITRRRKEELEREHNYLKTTRSREVDAMITEAMWYGDLENNAEYDAAKSEQQKLRDRIAEIEKILTCAAVIETEEKHLSGAFTEELKQVLQSCGLSGKQADAYAEYCRAEYEENGREQYGVLPAESGLETLKEAQRINSKKDGAFEFGEVLIDRFLHIPCDQWKSAKNAVMECFGCTRETVDSLFDEDAQWLLFTADDVYDAADYLKATFSDAALSWKIFRRGILFGLEKRIKARTAAIMDLLGEEFGLQVIRADAEASQWIYWGYYSDPVECIAYMKECGLTPDRILTLIRQEPNFLYRYKTGRRLSYQHDQGYIDRIIQRYK